MRVCLHCMTEYREGFDHCADCGAPLTDISEAKMKMLKKAGHPVKVITLEEKKEKEFFKALLSLNDIGYYAVEEGTSERGAEYQPEDIYVEERFLPDAQSVAEDFKSDIASMKESADIKSRMIHPVILTTLLYGPGSLIDWLREHHIQCGCDWESSYDTSRRNGNIIFKYHIFVDEMYYDEAKAEMDDFLEQQAIEEAEENAERLAELDDEEALEGAEEGGTNKKKEIGVGAKTGKKAGIEAEQGTEEIGGEELEELEYLDLGACGSGFLKWLQGKFK